MTSRYLQLSHVRLHAMEAGEGPLVLFLHGFPEFWYAWREQLAEFGRDHHAVAVDMRGYNLSDKPEGVSAYAPHRLVADVKELLEQLSPGRPAVLVGHDWGGVIAWGVAAAHPELLERLVIINAPHPTLFARELTHNDLQRKASAYVTLFRSDRAEAVLSGAGFAALAAMVFETSVRPEVFTDEDRQAYLEAWSQPGALTAGLNYYRALPVNPAEADRLTAKAALSLAQIVPARIRVPTLVLWGEQDPALLPSNLNGLEEVVDSLQVQRFPTASHWIVHEEPEAVNTAIRRFLSA